MEGRRHDPARLGVGCESRLGLDRDVGAERETAEQERLAGELLAAAPGLDDREGVVDLAAPFVPGAFGSADAAEVEAHARPADLDAGARDRLRDFVVERSAALRMRMADDGQAERIACRAVERAFDAPGRAGDLLANRSRCHGFGTEN